MEQNIIQNDNPLIDLSHLKDSFKKIDLEYIVSIDPKQLTFKQKKEAKRLGLLTLQIISTFERAKRDLNIFDYDVPKLLKTG